MLLCLSNFKAQVTIFSENCGTTGAGSVSSYSNNFQNSNCQVTFGGNANVNNTSASNNYSFSSGGNNISLTSGQSFTIGGINTLEYTSVNLKYGLNVDNFFLTSASPGFSIHTSTDGISYTPLSRTQGFWLVAASWQTETAVSLPQAANLYLRFTNNSGSLDFRIDDIVLTGTPVMTVTQPATYSLGSGSYNLSSWPGTSGAGTYPPNMFFHYGNINTINPTLAQVNASQNYSLAYNQTCGTRITGQGTNGFSFKNENAGHSNASTGNLGEAVLALNTSCRTNIGLQWRAGTISSTSNIYRLRAQYRIGASGAFTDISSTVSAIEYVSGAATNTFSVVLPSACENTSTVQIRWVYYYDSGTGSASEIFLDDITVSSVAYPVITPVSSQTICGGKTISAITFSANPSATFNWTNNNTAIGLAASGSGNISSFTPGIISSSSNNISTISFSAALATCTATSNFTITVLAPQATSIWNGTVSTDWFNPDNWSSCVCGANTSATIATAPNNPLINSSASAKNIQLNSSSTLSLTGNNTLSLYGNWVNNGSLNSSSLSTILLTGSTTQSLGGSSTTVFKNLTLSNPAGCLLGSAQEIEGTLLLSLGAFSTNNQLTLISSLAGTGRIGPISSSADIIGNVAVQRLAPGGSTGWAQLGAPISSALTMSDWNDDFVITCQSCPNGYFNFTSVYSYSEAAAGSYSAAAKYTPISSISDPLQNGKGYWVYLGNGQTTSSDITFDVSGTISKSACLSCTGPVTIPIGKTNNTSAIDDGWNLISNPLPSAISWSLLLNGNSNVENAFYVYNADENGGAGGYTSYVNNVGSGGLTDAIPMCQGFYVHATAPATLTAGENIKVGSNPVFFRPSSATKPILRLILSGAGSFTDMTTFYFENGGSPNFQSAFDAHKLNFDPSSIPYIASLSGTVLTGINGLPELSANMTVPVEAITPVTGTFSFSINKSEFLPDVCVTLHDLYTGIITDLVNSDYSCVLFDTTTAARFRISFFRTPLNAGTTLIQPTCSNPAGGMISASAQNSGPWNYEWWQGNNLIRTAYNKITADTLYGVNGAAYNVRLNTVGQCDRFSGNISVTGVVAPDADFTSNTSLVYLSDPAMIQFNHASNNAAAFSWDFGDEAGTSTSPDPSYRYTKAGNFKVLLITESSTGCIDSAAKNITVVNDITAISGGLPNEKILLKYDKAARSYTLTLHFFCPKNVTLLLSDLKGNTMDEKFHPAVSIADLPVNFNNCVGGIYLLTVRIEGENDRLFKLIR